MINVHQKIMITNVRKLDNISISVGQNLNEMVDYLYDLYILLRYPLFNEIIS